MAERSLTSLEKALLRKVFGETLPYNELTVMDNDWNLGGQDNSITPRGTPRMAVTLWKPDYGALPMNNGDTGTFVHEMAHVWQFYHGENNIWNAIKTGFWNSGTDYGKLIEYCKKNGCNGSSNVTLDQFDRSYVDAYNYDLSDSANFTSYNFEAQASIVEDYWLLLQGASPNRNKGTNKSLAAYTPFIVQVQNAGPPRGPGGIPLPTT